MINNMLIVALLLVLFFSLIHLIEVLAFFARLSGVFVGRVSMGYTLQNAVFMMTRAFTMLLLPMLGFIVDSRVSSSFYLLIVAASLLTASFLGGLVVLSRMKVVSAFCEVLKLQETKGGLFLHLLKFPLLIFASKRKHQYSCGAIKFKSAFFYGGAFIFGIYSVSVFLAFYFGLIFYDYRTSISQLSGFTNALATVLLTFYIEPKLSSAIDSDKELSADCLSTLMLGRVFGTGLFGIIFLISYLIERG